MEFDYIKTERLSLRKITPDVLAFVHRSYDDNMLMEFFGLKEPSELEREKLQFEKGMTTFNKTFLWFHLLIDGQNVGHCGYHTWYLDHARTELFYFFNSESYKGIGLMTEALSAVIDYGFTQMQLHRIEAMTADYNLPSLKILDKFGFVKEGVLRGHYLVDGVFEDSLVFALLKHEYPKVK